MTRMQNVGKDVNLAAESIEELSYRLFRNIFQVLP